VCGEHRLLLHESRYWLSLLSLGFFVGFGEELDLLPQLCDTDDALISAYVSVIPSSLIAP
jgi:hypothetical protein